MTLPGTASVTEISDLWFDLHPEDEGAIVLAHYDHEEVECWGIDPDRSHGYAPVAELVAVSIKSMEQSHTENDCYDAGAQRTRERLANHYRVMA